MDEPRCPKQTESVDNSFALLARRRGRNAGTTELTPATAQRRSGCRAGHASRAGLPRAARRLVEELDLCRRYYEATFPSKPVDRLIFVGGEARQRALCQQIAAEMGLAAQVGDPLVRMGRISEIGIESGIDRRQPQPGWAVAIGLSMGPARRNRQWPT